jgi:hypothetical protein
MSFSVQCGESDCSGDDAMRDAPRPPSSCFSPTLEWITSITHEPEKSQQSSVEAGGLDEKIRLDIDTPYLKGGRPPKQWPHSGRRLLARFVTAAFPNLTFIHQALKQDGFAVRLVPRTLCSYPVLTRRSIRHIEGKVREMFGSRKPNDASFDSKLRPKDSVQMDNRVRAFVECKEQWHMLRKRAVLESHISVPSRTTQAGIFDICHDDQRALFVHPQENPPDEAFQARIQSLSTSRQEYPGLLDCTQTTLLDKGSLVSYVEDDTDVSMMEIGSLEELDLGSPSSLPLGGWRTSSEQGVNDMYRLQSGTVGLPGSPPPWQGRHRGSFSAVPLVRMRNNSYTSISRPIRSPTTLQGRHASSDIDLSDTNLPDNHFEWPFSPDDKVHEEILPMAFDVPESTRFTQNPMANFDDFSYGSLSSSGYEGSYASARDRRRARNREAQRQYRTYRFNCFARLVLILDYSQDNERSKSPGWTHRTTENKITLVSPESSRYAICWATTCPRLSDIARPANDVDS